MSTKINKIVLIKNPNDQVIKFKFFLVGVVNAEQVITKNTLYDAKSFLMKTQLPYSLLLVNAVKQLGCAYQNLLKGKKIREVINIWQNTETEINNHPKEIHGKEGVKIIKTSQMGDIVIHQFNSEDDTKAVNSALERLKRDFPDILSDNIEINWLISKVFLSKLQQHCVVRNQTYLLKNGKESFVVPRVDLYCTINPPLFCGLDENQKILFSGKIKSGEFLIDDIRIISNPIIRPEDKELIATFYIGADGKGRKNFLKTFTEHPAKGRETRFNEIQEWDKYLDWKNELAKLRIQALKYIGFRFELSQKQISFLVVFNAPQTLFDFTKYLRRENTSIFSNQYSSNRFVFQLNKSDKADNYMDYDSGVNLDFISIGKPFPINKLDEEKWNYSRPFARKYKKNELREEFSDVSIEYLINGIKKEAGNVLLAEIRFALSDYATDWIHQQVRINGILPDDAENRLSGEFYADGFIATSQIGDFALIKRLKRGISDYTSGNMSSQSLSEWLFNIKKARPISELIHIKKWQNKKLNDRQKQAVEKIVAAPDVCLIQGPPGTGKTTVIAEAIFQFVVQHKRVLVASQANLAVDNALERLISNPKIRAIRLGNERKFDVSVSNITERNVLKTFYNTLIDFIDKEYLCKWDESERILKDLTDDREEAGLLVSKLQALKEENIKIDSSIKQISTKFNFEESQSTVKMYENEQTKLNGIVEYCIGKKQNLELPDLEIFIDDVLRGISPHLNSLQNSGIELSTIVLSSNTKHRFCYNVIQSTVLVINLIEKLKSSDNEELIVLKAKEETLLKKMETDVSFLQEWQLVRKKIQQLTQKATSITLNVEEEALFDISIARITQPEAKLSRILSVLDKVKFDINGILNTTIQTARKHCQAFEEIIKHLKDRIKEFEENTAELRHNLENISSEITERQIILDKICQKYSCRNNEILGAIEDKKAELRNQLFNTARKEDWESVFTGFKKWITNIPDYNSERNYYLDSYINGCNVVGVSCTESFRTLLDRGFKDFDVVIIDEVSKATPPELLLPMLKGQKIILVGDHRQLPPLFNEHENSYQEVVSIQADYPDVSVELTMEDFLKYKDMVTSSLFQKYFESADNSIKETLTYQYRMHNDIMDIVNTFYDGFLEDGNVKTKTGEEKSHNLRIDSVFNTNFIVPEKHAYWIDSSELHEKKIYEQRETGSTSALNIVEAYGIRELLRKIETQYANDENRSEKRISVGVISFYALQVDLLRQLIQTESFHAIDVEINTVDRFQGKEKEVILVSLVRNSPKARHNTDSFIASFQRINVAFSRAQNLLVIFGAKNLYADQPVVITDMNNGTEKTVMAYRDIIGKLNMNGAFFSVDDIIPEQTVNEVLEEYKKQSGGNQI